MFHTGHLRLLKAAKALGDILIAGVNTDELVKLSASQPIVIIQLITGQ